jgi:hypothetical protein
MFNGPFEKVQLTNGGFHKLFVVKGDLNTVPSTKRVEPFLAIRLEFQFIVIVDFKPDLFREIGSRERIYRIILFRVIGDEPIDDTQ